MKLQGKTALITGAGSGMGRAMAALFAAEGAAVAVVDVVEDRVREVVESIQNQGAQVIGITADVSKQEEIDRMVETATGRFGRLDILCNNAGVMDGFHPVGEVSDELWDRVMGINLEGPFRTCRLVVPMMVKQGGGVIVNTASVGGLFGGRAGTAYTVSKHGLIGLTKSIAWYYHDQGIRCNAICPGGIETAIGAGPNPSEIGFSYVQRGLATSPPPGSPEDVAHLALFLVSDDSKYINGATVVIDGGWTTY
ncbi:3-ketoacyl-ACP reductase [Kyrpidia spormannii]|uniref:3-ketoacyl-ACP reductase n=1 Tax=Kyrpidia spormannii TaxID=2055160 RepID=A0A2K8N4G3_9BACL|nr:glucose 1-dehydrogenase [Kyrpidia spormannii]ATY84288.1 3-ketoacyl-ACP reductase [Kyrpidia spormannii]